MINIKLLIAVSLLILPLSVGAWNAQGHKVIGKIAYDYLDDEVIEQVDNLLDALGYPNTTEGFLETTIWMDTLKHHNIKSFNHWHYTNKPYNPNHLPITSNARGQLLWAIKQKLTVLQSAQSSQTDKAFSMRFLVHLVGDAHQPLHCINYFSQQFPNGDLGGNLYTIKAGDINNLHRFWDAGLGLLNQVHHNNIEEISHIALTIEQHYPIDYFSKASFNLNIEAWIAECYWIGKTFAYQIPLGEQPSLAYIHDGQAIVAQRLALAGYRLAYLLNTVFKSNENLGE